MKSRGGSSSTNNKALLRASVAGIPVHLGTISENEETAFFSASSTSISLSSSPRGDGGGGGGSGPTSPRGDKTNNKSRNDLSSLLSVGASNTNFNTTPSTAGSSNSSPSSPRSSSDEKVIRIVAVGDGSCGAKTCLLKTYANNGAWPEEMFVAEPTVRATYTKDLIHNNVPLKLMLEDTAGQEEYETLRTQAYKDADMVFIGYSIVNIASFENVFEKWYPEVRSQCPQVPIVLIGCKLDLVKLTKETDTKSRNRSASVASRRDTAGYITHEEAALMKDRIGAIAQYQISNITGEGVNDLFEFVLSHFAPKEKGGGIGGHIKRRFEGLFSLTSSTSSTNLNNNTHNNNNHNSHNSSTASRSKSVREPRHSMHERSRSSGIMFEKELSRKTTIDLNSLVSPRASKKLLQHSQQQQPQQQQATTGNNNDNNTSNSSNNNKRRDDDKMLSARKRSISSDGMDMSILRTHNKKEKNKKDKSGNSKKKEKDKEKEKEKEKEKAQAIKKKNSSSKKKKKASSVNKHKEEKRDKKTHKEKTGGEDKDNNSNTCSNNNNISDNSDNSDIIIDNNYTNIQIITLSKDFVETGEKGSNNTHNTHNNKVKQRVLRSHRRHSSHGTKQDKQEPQRPSVMYGSKLPLEFYEINGLTLSTGDLSPSNVDIKQEANSEEEDDVTIDLNDDVDTPSEEEEDDDDDDGESDDSAEGVEECVEHSGPASNNGTPHRLKAKSAPVSPQVSSTDLLPAGTPLKPVIRVTIRRFGKRGGEIIRLPPDEESLFRLAEEKLLGVGPEERHGSSANQKERRFECMRTPSPMEAKISFDLIQDGDIICFTTPQQEKEFD